MFHQLMDFLKTPKSPGAPPPQDLRIAVAVLLLETAHQDDQFGPQERSVIERLLVEKFALSRDECLQLLAFCEKTIASMVQIHPYTVAIFERMTEGERVDFIEMLWEVAYADGVLDPEEDALVRRLGTLIHVPDRERVLARQRVVSRLMQTNAARDVQ